MNRSFPTFSSSVSLGVTWSQPRGFSSLFDAYSPRCELAESSRRLFLFHSSLFRPRLFPPRRDDRWSPDLSLDPWNARISAPLKSSLREEDREKEASLQGFFRSAERLRLNDFEFSRNVTSLGFLFAFVRASAADEFSKRDRREKGQIFLLWFVCDMILGESSGSSFRATNNNI